MREIHLVQEDGKNNDQRKELNVILNHNGADTFNTSVLAGMKDLLKNLPRAQPNSGTVSKSSICKRWFL
jgi:hypothetical protein